MSLIAILELHVDDIHAIWQAAKTRENPIKGNVAWSFEGNGIRTRTTFIQAFRDLGLSYTELPNLLKTSERPTDLAGYLDAFYESMSSENPITHVFWNSARCPADQ